MVRAGRRGEDFIARWYAGLQEDHDDQRVVNRLFAKESVNWPQADYRLRFDDREFRCFESFQAATLESGLTIALLPYREFQRIPEDHDRAIVARYFSVKSGGGFEAVLRGHGLWVEEQNIGFDETES